MPTVLTTFNAYRPSAMVVMVLAVTCGITPLAGAADSTADTIACRAEVLKFEETIGFVRQAQGNAAASAMREKLLPAKIESDILFSEGYCGIARYLREKKLTR